MDRDKLIALLKKHHTAFSAMLNVYNHLPFNNSIKGKVKLSTGGYHAEKVPDRQRRDGQ